MLHVKNIKPLYWAAPIFILIIVNILNIENPILERHSFRQTQTAISAYYIIANGFSFSYLTPVLGKGLSIPFEFPIYQFICSQVTNLFGFNLDVSGRLVSLFFSVLCLLVNDQILKELDCSAGKRVACMFGICLSPIFLFWSGTFMIESCALFFALSSLYFAILFKKTSKVYAVILWFVFISLGLLQKVTTCIFPFAIGYIILMCSFIGSYRNPFNIKYLLLLAAFCVPLLLAQAWVNFTDLVKMSNEVASQRLTSDALQLWNFGTVSQRFSYEFWRAIFIRVVLPSTCFGIAIPICIHTIFSSKDRPIKFMLLGFALLFLGPWLLFTNLYFVHDYYQFSVIVFFVDFVFLGVLYSDKLHSPAKKSIIVLMCIISFAFFVFQYGSSKFTRIDRSYKTLELSKYINETLDVSQTFMLLGYDWSSEVSYYSQRKSFSVPDWYLSSMNFDIENFDQKYGVDMIVVCPNQLNAYGDQLPLILLHHSFVKVVNGCKVYL